MNEQSGADTLTQTLLAGQVDTCFANPGTSEMHFVGALDHNPGMRCILGLFEGVVTGAADGYYRVAQRPAATLLHLLPGLGNGIANLHNARKARSGIVNIVGDHATYYAKADSPLSGEVEALARTISDWTRTTSSVAHIGQDAAEAVQRASAHPGEIATLILPADVSWTSGGSPVVPPPPLARSTVDAEKVTASAKILREGRAHAILFLGDAALRGKALHHAGLIAQATGCRLLSEIHNARCERGAGRVDVQRLPYTSPVDKALDLLADTEEIVLAGAVAPVTFFAYPGRPTELHPPGCAIRTLARPEDEVEGALAALVHELGIDAESAPVTSPRAERGRVVGPITLEGLGEVIAANLPEQAIVVDEAATSGRSFFAQCANAAPHDWMVSRGASIGYALPSAIGAAVAAPDRKVLALTGDGSGMYTVQSLWTMARESLDITVVVFANRAYRILEAEFRNMGLGQPSSVAAKLLDIGNPDLDWCAIARGHGLPAVRVSDLEQFGAALLAGFGSGGPSLIEVML